MSEEVYNNFILYLKKNNLYNACFDNMTYQEKNRPVVGIPNNYFTERKIFFKNIQLYYYGANVSNYSGQESLSRKIDENYLRHLLCGENNKSAEGIFNRLLVALNIKHADVLNVNSNKFKPVSGPTQNAKVVLYNKHDQKRHDEILSRLDAISKNPNVPHEIIKMEGNALSVFVNDHFEIRREWLPYLKYIDLSAAKCGNLKVSGIDFRGTNISVDPQLVYGKDLSNSYFGINNFVKVFQGCKTDGLSIVGKSNQNNIVKEEENIKVM